MYKKIIESITYTRELVSTLRGRHPDCDLSPSRQRAKLAKQLVKKGKCLAVADTPVGLLSVDLRDYGVGYPLFVNQEYEPIETEFFRRTLKPGGVVVDVGANIGYFTALASQIVGENGLVMAFEPDPHNFKLLSQNVKRLGKGNIQLFNCALGAKKGETVISKSEFNYGDHRIETSKLQKKTSRSTEKGISMAVLDDIIKATDHDQLDFIKIDTQGYEQFVLEGMSHLIKESGVSTLLLEFWPTGLAQQGCSGESVVEILSNGGFQLFHLDSEAELIPIAPGNTIDLAMSMGDGDPDGAYINLVARPS